MRRRIIIANRRLMKKWLNRVITSLDVYDSFNSVDSGLDKIQVISYLNLSCPPCLNDIDRWNQFAIKYRDYGVRVKLVCYSDDYFEYFKYLRENGTNGEFNGTFLLGTANVFLRNNKFIRSKSSGGTVVTDENSKVILHGSPLQSAKVSEAIVQLSK